MIGSPAIVSILSAGAVTPLGRDLDQIARKLADAPAGSTLPKEIDEDLLHDPAVDRRLRRADRFTRMAVIAAMDAWNAALAPSPGNPGEGQGEGAANTNGSSMRNHSHPNPLPDYRERGQARAADVAAEKIGLIVATGFGPHCRGFKFIDGILDCGDAEALPTDFSHSVHGTAAAYITELLELRGPSLTIADFETGFEQALQLACAWLTQGICQRVLLGVVDELGDVLIHCALRLTPLTPGEGAVFFMLAPPQIPGIARLTISPEMPGIRPVDFSTHFGNTPASSAFGVLGGLLAAVDSVATFKPSCDPRAASLLLTKTPTAKRHASS